MKKNKVKNNFLVELRRIPIIQVACEKCGVSRNSVYRWKNQDKEFSAEMEKALEEGEALVNDMSESQLLSLIKEKNWQAISFWLRHRNPKFKDKVEITTILPKEELTPEQESVVREALKLATTESEKIIKINENNHEQPTNNNTSVIKSDDKGQESKNGNN